MMAPIPTAPKTARILRRGVVWSVGNDEEGSTSGFSEQVFLSVFDVVSKSVWRAIRQVSQAGEIAITAPKRISVAEIVRRTRPSTDHQGPRNHSRLKSLMNRVFPIDGTYDTEQALVKPIRKNPSCLKQDLFIGTRILSQ